ncbi:spore coat polysaccharide biosynthesis protein SpsF [Tissierella praeacuta DSM 18095]|uniref:Spore coat polysaccharide biosynthesis protein SpsF n=1 Tax=Tissierella praeacuta DSM 18095 TaxID=1123404 RepID=A0A1M4X291_9FIRM|nr:glycosyltransferase family protein [Tissierella praeacuta]SHE87570.1 spore coat polysaccharide biosynthesis protein SpsF [Tissierella praeacuta DSM 18095]SUO99649.1 3-deoxy-manno-octulosonate cytidylyltransferase [Tissierella praeacuta]
MKTIAIIQARMGSARLPGKVMMKIGGKTVLDHVIARIKQSKEVDEIVIATTIKENDNQIVDEVNRLGVKFFRGSEEDVLSRYYYAAKENEADIVARITSDCPLIDPKIVDEVIKFYKEHEYAMVVNASSDLSKRTFPRGLDVEIFSFDQLEIAFTNADEKYQREHVTPFIYENNDNIFYYKNNIDYSKHRWTLDTKEDFELICKIYDELYKGSHDFFLKDIIELFQRKPELFNINAHIKQKELKNAE